MQLQQCREYANTIVEGVSPGISLKLAWLAKSRLPYTRIKSWAWRGNSGNPLPHCGKLCRSRFEAIGDPAMANLHLESVGQLIDR
ncbi:MAG: hypothetical protein AB2541_10105, partial [Candidatus Thiodiazotropha sp.]